MNFGEKLNMILKERQISVAELARRSGISADTLYSYRRRNSRKIDPEVYTAVADALNIDVTYFLDPATQDVPPRVDERLANLIRRVPEAETILDLTPSELKRVVDFARGLIAARPKQE